MKPILIDNIKEEFGHNTSSNTVEVDGVKYTGYNIAKPMNYDPEYFTFIRKPLLFSKGFFKLFN